MSTQWGSIQLNRLRKCQHDKPIRLPNNVCGPADRLAEQSQNFIMKTAGYEDHPIPCRSDVALRFSTSSRQSNVALGESLGSNEFSNCVKLCVEVHTYGYKSLN